jgi:hypothetical protein
MPKTEPRGIANFIVSKERLDATLGQATVLKKPPSQDLDQRPVMSAKAIDWRDRQLIDLAAEIQDILTTPGRGTTFKER